MKKFFLLSLLLLLPFVCSLAYDFEVDGIYYNIVSKRHHQVEVTHWEELTGQFGEPIRRLYAPCCCGGTHHDACEADDHHHHHHHHDAVLSKQIRLDSLSNAREQSAYIGAVTIPAAVKYKGRTYSVVGIGDGAFYKRQQLLSVSMPPTIRYVGQSSFESCLSLDSVNIPLSLDSIGFAAFRNCRSLRHLDLNDRIRYIDVYAFAYCHNLTYLRWPMAVHSMAGNVFFGCQNLRFIELPHPYPPTIEDKGLSMNFRGIVFIIPAEMLPVYQSDAQWRDKRFDLLPDSDSDL